MRIICHEYREHREYNIAGRAVAHDNFTRYRGVASAKWHEALPPNGGSGYNSS